MQGRWSEIGDLRTDAKCDWRRDSHAAVSDEAERDSAGDSLLDAGWGPVVYGG